MLVELRVLHKIETSEPGQWAWFISSCVTHAVLGKALKPASREFCLEASPQ